MKNLLTITVLATVFAFTGTVHADMISFSLGAGNEDVLKSEGLLGSLSLIAEDVGTGVKFTFQSNYDLGDSNHADGAGKIFDNNFLIWNTHDVFSGGENVTAGGKLNGAKYPGTDVKLGTADYTAGTDGYSYSEIDELWTTSFVLDYTGDNVWADFISTLVTPVGLMDQIEAFTIGVHLQSLEDGNSAKVLTFTINGDPATTPEPATMLILGLAAAGGLPVALRRRMARKAK